MLGPGETLINCAADAQVAHGSQLDSSGDAPEVISKAALVDKEPLCMEALDLFVSIMGAVAGNVALTGMTTGGIYLGGGIPPKILSKLDDGTFLEAFTAKGRFKDLLSTIPVRVILNDKAALLGAACCALAGSITGTGYRADVSFSENQGN